MLTADSTSGAGAGQVAPHGAGSAVCCAAGWWAPMLGDPLKALLFGELAESPQRRLGMPAGLVIPNAAVALANMPKCHEMVRVGGRSFILVAGWLSSYKSRNNECGPSGRNSRYLCMGIRLIKEVPLLSAQEFSLRNRTFSSLPLQPSLLSVSVYFGFLFAHLHVLLPPPPVKFRSPSIPGKTELEGFENHFERQPSPIVFPMAYGDNNSAAAPDLLASITLQDQLIPVKITYVTEE